jgi:hypothetical protein
MLLKYFLAFSLLICMYHKKEAVREEEQSDLGKAEVSKIAKEIDWERQQTRAMDSAEGVPSKSVMSSNWCTTFFPGNKGFPVNNSANIQPMLQISIAGVYCRAQVQKKVSNKILNSNWKMAWAKQFRPLHPKENKPLKLVVWCMKHNWALGNTG